MMRNILKEYIRALSESDEDDMKEIERVFKAFAKKFRKDKYYQDVHMQMADAVDYHDRIYVTYTIDYIAPEHRVYGVRILPVKFLNDNSIDISYPKYVSVLEYVHYDPKWAKYYLTDFKHYAWQFTKYAISITDLERLIRITDNIHQFNELIKRAGVKQ